MRVSSSNRTSHLDKGLRTHENMERRTKVNELNAVKKTKQKIFASIWRRGEKGGRGRGYTSARKQVSHKRGAVCSDAPAREHHCASDDAQHAVPRHHVPSAPTCVLSDAMDEAQTV